MAYGKNKQNPNLKLFLFKIRSKDSNKQEVPVYLEVSEKVGDKYEVSKEAAYYVSGTLTGLEHDEHLWHGPKGDVLLQNAKAYLRDGDNLYILTVPYNIMGRSIVNALVNLKSFENIEISVYMTKGGPDKKSYPAAIVRQNDKRADWKYSVEQLPKPKEVPFKGTIIRDYTDVDAFFINEVKTFGAQLGATRSSQAPVAAVSVPTAVPADDDQVPF